MLAFRLHICSGVCGTSKVAILDCFLFSIDIKNNVIVIKQKGLFYGFAIHSFLANNFAIDEFQWWVSFVDYDGGRLFSLFHPRGPHRVLSA